jgi:hypothetical protein
MRCRDENGLAESRLAARPQQEGGQHNCATETVRCQPARQALQLLGRSPVGGKWTGKAALQVPGQPLHDGRPGRRCLDRLTEIAEAFLRLACVLIVCGA